MPNMVVGVEDAGPWGVGNSDCPESMRDSIFTVDAQKHLESYQALRVECSIPFAFRSGAAVAAIGIALAAPQLRLLPCALSAAMWLLFCFSDWRLLIILPMIGTVTILLFHKLEPSTILQFFIFSVAASCAQFVNRHEGWKLFESLVKTERKRYILLEQMKVLFQVINLQWDGIFYLDDKCVITRNNRSLESMLACHELEQQAPGWLLGRCILDWCATEDDRRRLRAFCQRAGASALVERTTVMLRSVSGDKHRDDGNGELLEVELGGLQAPPTAKPSGIHQAGACLAIRVLRRVEEEEAKAQPTTPEDDIADGGLPHRSVSSNRINTSGLTKNLEEETLAYTAESACTLDDAQWARRGAASCYSAPPVMMQPKLLEFVRTATIAECDADGDCLPPSAIVWVEGALDPTMLSNVKVGQRVLCFDRLSRGTKYAEVTDVRTFDAQHSDWVRVVLEDDTELMMTADHPLFPEVGEAGAKEADSGLVKAGDLVVGKHSLEVLKMVPVPVKEVIGLERDAEGAAEKQPPSKRVALSVQQGDRHSVYVAHKEGGVGMAVGSASISVDQVATRLRDSISIKNTFIELLDEGSDEEQMPLRRRTYSAPVDLELYRFSCAEEDDTNSVAASSIGRQKGLRRSYSRVSCASSKISAASSWLTSKCSSVSASSGPVHRQIILGNQPKDRDFTAGSGPGIEERTGVAELSAALAAKQAGLRSIGSLNHCQGHCYPCLMETWFHNGKSTQGCKFGLFCGRCHEPHSEAEVRKMRKNAKKPQGRGK